jgi:hypothetical protein
MGNMFWKGGSRNATRPMPTTGLKMEDACNLYNVIEFFCWRTVTKTKKEGLLVSQTPNGISTILQKHIDMLM